MTFPTATEKEVALLEREGGPVVGDGVDDAVHAREHLAVALRLPGELGGKDGSLGRGGEGSSAAGPRPPTPLSASPPRATPTRRSRPAAP